MPRTPLHPKRLENQEDPAFATQRLDTLAGQLAPLLEDALRERYAARATTPIEATIDEALVRGANEAIAWIQAQGRTKESAPSAEPLLAVTAEDIQRALRHPEAPDAEETRAAFRRMARGCINAWMNALLLAADEETKQLTVDGGLKPVFPPVAREKLGRSGQFPEDLWDKSLRRAVDDLAMVTEIEAILRRFKQEHAAATALPAAALEMLARKGITVVQAPTSPAQPA